MVYHIAFNIAKNSQLVCSRNTVITRGYVTSLSVTSTSVILRSNDLIKHDKLTRHSKEEVNMYMLRLFMNTKFEVKSNNLKSVVHINGNPKC